MKTLKKTTYILLGILLASFISLLITQSTIIKIIWYQKPDIQTYKIFPQNTIEPSDAPFHFIRSIAQRNDLDTLQVYDSKHQLVSLSSYLKTVKAKVFMVIRNDTILYEKYTDGYTKKTLMPTFSISKSLMSLMIGIALNDGAIKSLNDNITQYIPELKNNKAFENITIENVLNMQSGLSYKELGNGFLSALFSDEGKYYYTHDVKKELRQLTKDTLPGTQWKYKSIDPLLLAWVLEEATGKKIAHYFEQKVWKNIGTEHQASWGLDHANGLANTASKFQTTAIDLAKIGRLYLKKGVYNNNLILPEDWITRSTSIGDSKPLTSKYWQKSTYHYLWWLPQQGDKGDYAAQGMGGQILYIDPKTNTIIVQLADGGKPDYPYRKISRYLSNMPFQYPPRKE